MTTDKLKEIIDSVASTEKFTVAREKAELIFKTETKEQGLDYAYQFYEDGRHQIQSLGVFILGYYAHEDQRVLEFLRETVSLNSDWRVQEILAMAFDMFCKARGYEDSLPVIDSWLNDGRANVRRAVTEGLRIWTGRPYFKENPCVAVEKLARLKADESEYVRKSVGNSLRDISRKFPDLIKAELENWEVTDKRVMQVYKLAAKFVL